MRRLIAAVLALVLTAAGASAAGAKPHLEVAAWLPTSWDRADAWTSLDAHAEALDVVSPFLYHLELDTSITSLQGADERKWPERIRRAGGKVIPTISNGYSPDVAHAVFVEEDTARWHAERIRKLVSDAGWDGIDIDYEAVRPEDRDTFSVFVETLAEKLHADRRKLIVTVQPKTSDTANWNGPGGTDFRRIGAAADVVRIMAYDEHTTGSKSPGTIGSDPWTRRALDYAVSTIPREKLVLGIPLYGYDWGMEVSSLPLASSSEGSSAKGQGVAGGNSEDEALRPSSFVLDSFLAGTGLSAKPRILAAVSRTFANIKEKILDAYAPAVTWHAALGESSLRYVSTVDGLAHETFFANARSVSRRLEIAREYEIRGVSFWRLGGEDPEIWARVAEKARGDYGGIAAFPDVEPGTAVDHATRRLLAAGIISGYVPSARCIGSPGFRCDAVPGPAMFHPEASVSRAELLKFAFRAHGLEERELAAPTAIRDFVDVGIHDWEYQLVRAARALRLVTGIPAGSVSVAGPEVTPMAFQPDAEVSRTAALKIFLRADGWTGGEGASWAADVRAEAEARGMIRPGAAFAGFRDAPDGALTRAEAAILTAEALGWE